MSSGKRPISTQRHFELAALSVILALKEINLGLCMTGIQNLSNEQLNVIRQLANTFEKSLARQIDNAMRSKPQSEMQDAYRLSPRQGGQVRSSQGRVRPSEVLDRIMKDEPSYVPSH